jgi:TonB family protein
MLADQLWKTCGNSFRNEPRGNIRRQSLLRFVRPENLSPCLTRSRRLTAAMAGLAGPVILECHVDTKGRVTEAKVLRGDEPLAEAALKAVRKWRYEPLELDGVPTEFILTVTVNFKPDGLSLNVTDLLRSLDPPAGREERQGSGCGHEGARPTGASLARGGLVPPHTGSLSLAAPGPMTRHRAPKRDRTLPRPQKRG